MIVIATSYSAECLMEYLRTCNEPLKSALFVETGYTSRICTSEETWDGMPQNVQDAIKARTLGFIDGWEIRDNK
jgi:hypothetical protein